MDCVSLVLFQEDHIFPVSEIIINRPSSWFDADTVLLNNNVPWTIFLPPSEGLFRDINMLISKDWQGFNAGVFLIRVCEWSINLLSDSIALPRLRPDVELTFREQDALKWAFERPECLKYRVYQPRHWFNVYDSYYESRGEVVMNGSLLVHFPGMGGSRPDAMGRWLDKLDKAPSELRLPLANTTYPQEVEAYWRRLRSAAEMLQRSTEYKDEVKEENWDVFISDDRKIAGMIADAENELHQTIHEDAYDKEKLRQGVLKLDSAVRNARKEVDAYKKKVEAEEKAREEARVKAEEEAQKKAEAAEVEKAEAESRRKAQAEAKAEAHSLAKVMETQAARYTQDDSSNGGEGNSSASAEPAPPNPS